MEKVIEDYPLSSQVYVNDEVSWQARRTNDLMRCFVKRHMNKPFNIDQFRQFARKVDFVSGRSVTDMRIAEVDANGVSAQWLTTSAKQQRVILYFHGGGFCIHMPKTYNALVAQLCRKLNANALVPDYRLAPEHPFPAGVNDCYQSYCWLLQQGYKAENIIIAGDSAGGCLTLTTLQKIRDAGKKKPAAAVLLSPGTNCSIEDLMALEPNLESVDPMLNKQSLAAMINLYLPNEINQKDPLISPLYADYNGFPPLQCHVGSNELIFNHSASAMKKAVDTGVDARLHIWKDMPHVHPLFSWLPESKQAIDMMVNFMNKYLPAK